ncbi:MAG: ABC transporter permease [Acidimicrobiia bacterium]|nr:ABC transporter permease [Acidimicrobiia bacterium]MBT8191855.1 ABC transporter permease [Acidimicrobiia bacterium]NNL98276.1 ABC transporter permease [Acidimicrobiia bacterium]
MTRVNAVLLPGFVVAVSVIGLLVLAGTNPWEPLKIIVEGSIGWPPFEESSARKVGDTFMVWVPIALASAGLIITFNAGMWNIGIEGQIILGAIAASFVAREVSAPRPVLILLTILAGAIGGLLWGLLVGVLRTAGGVNEIFGGLGLDFVALSLTTYLIIGPWARAGVASTSGTDSFPDEALLPSFAGSKLSPLMVSIAVLALIAVWLLFRGTSYGLKLKAVGRNRPSAFLLGIPTNRYLLGAFMLCGALAGMAGTSQATGFHGKLIPVISGNYGFLAILVVLLARFRPVWVIPISFFFAMIAVGSPALQLRLDVNATLGGVLQGVLVLSTMFGLGWGAYRAKRSMVVANEDGAG